MKADFTLFKRKIYLQMFWILLGTVAAGALLTYLIIDGVLQAPFADLFVFFAEKAGLDTEEALADYHMIFRSNKVFWLACGFLLLLLLSCRMMIAHFTRAFDRVSGGIHELLEEAETPISLSEELGALEDDLNAARVTLRSRKAEMEAVERRKDELVLYLAHDLKTPLTSVIGYLTLLETQPDMPAEQRLQYTGIAIKKARRLEQLIGEFFEITRLDLADPPPLRQEVDLSMLLDQLADEFYPIISQRDLTITADYPALLFVPADADKLARVFTNLLKNAAAYSHAHTAVQLAAWRTDTGRVCVRVRNRCDPIPADRLQRLFDKFYRLEQARGTDSGGAGLGLAIAKRIAESHGGTIRASSCPVYTEFVVDLPACTGITQADGTDPRQ